MTTPAAYREFGHDCLRWAGSAKDASDRETLTRAARLWLRTAAVMEGDGLFAKDQESFFRNLREKLN